MRNYTGLIDALMAYVQNCVAASRCDDKVTVGSQDRAGPQWASCLSAPGGAPPFLRDPGLGRPKLPPEPSLVAQESGELWEQWAGSPVHVDVGWATPWCWRLGASVETRDRWGRRAAQLRSLQGQGCS